MAPCLDHAEAIAVPPKPPGVSSLKLKKAQVEDRFFRQNCQVPLEPPPSPTSPNFFISFAYACSFINLTTLRNRKVQDKKFKKKLKKILKPFVKTFFLKMGRRNSP